MNRGERITKRTKTAVKKALLSLIKEKNYPAITVQEIVRTADVGRSTLYRHYPSKADILVDIHRDMFEKMFKGMSTAESWLQQTPRDELVVFFETYRKKGANPFQLSYKLGNDLDYLMNSINGQLCTTVEEHLSRAFGRKELQPPIPIIAVSIAAIYRELIISWFVRFQSVDTARFAAYIQACTSALVLGALDKGRG